MGQVSRQGLRLSALAFLVLLFASPAHAAPIVVATITPLGALFHYEYAITFNPLLDDDLAQVTITVLPNDTTLTSLVAPANFQTIYTAPLGLIDFLPAVGFDFQTSGTLSGFSFNSARAPAATTFAALTIFGDTLSGSTTGPLGALDAPIPEPATGMLLSLALGAGALSRRRRRRRRDTSTTD